MTGAVSVHTAHGIRLQEVLSDNTDDHGGTVPADPSIPRTKERSLNMPVQQDLPGCYVGQRKRPNYPAVYTVFPGCERSVTNASENDITWLLMTNDMSPTGQEIPGWAGSTVGFLLLQCSSGVVRHPRYLQVSVATRCFCRVLIFVSSQCLYVIYLFSVIIHWWVRKPSSGPNN